MYLEIIYTGVRVPLSVTADIEKPVHKYLGEVIKYFL